ncbi:hypothetical protein [Parendozoicomonas sp. Alg238-R29]|uniref:pilus assembly PilX family protein n=1 Tax=Parendozoicomonas sp. Alg238-R29 TaxID=2993446 RepID=UPI00248DCF22|nr:hypothetical protein [Parendozoicomonas sp. Alg238-R29]
MSQRHSQNGATLIIALVMLLVVTMVGLSGLYNITLQNKQVRTIEENRTFYSASNAIFQQALVALNAAPGSEQHITSPFPGTASETSYRGHGNCNGTGNNLEQLYRCKSVQTTIGFPATGDANQPDPDGPNRSYTLHYQYRNFGTEF